MKGSLSEKASKISIILVISITIGKFIAYLFSNSLTVYSEAWHGFSDLFTTVLIFIAIKISYSFFKYFINLYYSILIKYFDFIRVL